MCCMLGNKKKDYQKDRGHNLTTAITRINKLQIDKKVSEKDWLGRWPWRLVSGVC